jgi:tetratricopeptide (TPR) repeat protein
LGKVNRAKVIASAHKFLAKGNLKRAVKEYEKVLKDDPSDIRTKLKVADLLFRLGDKDRATATFEEVARFYASQGFLLKAVAVYKQVQKLKPDDVDVHQALAGLYQQIGLVSDAVGQYREAIALLGRTGNSLERLKTAQKMLELDPENARLRIELAEDFSKEGMIEEAVHEFRSAYEALRRNGLDEEAVVIAERLLYHQPDDWEVSKAVAAHYIALKDGLRALSRLQACYRARPTDPDVLELLGQVFEFLGQPQKAAAVLKALARQYDRTGLIRDRDEIYQRVLRMVPGDRSASEALRYAPAAAVPSGEELEFEAGTPRPEEILIPDEEDIGIDELEEDTSPEASTVEAVPTAPPEPARAPAPPPIPAPAPAPALDLAAARMAVAEDLSQVSAEISLEGGDAATVFQAVPSFVPAGSVGTGILDLSTVPAELHDDVQNLEFLVDAGLFEDAGTLLDEIRRKAGNLPVLERYRILIEAGS